MDFLGVVIWKKHISQISLLLLINYWLLIVTIIMNFDRYVIINNNNDNKFSCLLDECSSD